MRNFIRVIRRWSEECTSITHVIQLQAKSLQICNSYEEMWRIKDTAAEEMHFFSLSASIIIITNRLVTPSSPLLLFSSFHQWWTSDWVTQWALLQHWVELSVVRNWITLVCGSILFYLLIPCGSLDFLRARKLMTRAINFSFIRYLLEPTDDDDDNLSQLLCQLNGHMHTTIRLQRKPLYKKLN